MENKKLATLSFLLMILCVTFIVPVHGQQDIPLKVTRAVWGQDLNAPIKAYPGDTGVAFTVEVQNLSPNDTIKGVSGILLFKNGPFTDPYGNLNSTATGVPTIGEVLNTTDEIRPKGFLTLTFSIDINDDASPGVYTLDMLVSYSVKDGAAFVDGVTQTVLVNCQVSFAETTLSVSTAPNSVDVGETVRVTGNIQPAVDNAKVNLAFQRPDGTKLNEAVLTRIDGTFNYSYEPKIAGLWTVNASWLGNDKNVGNWGSATFEVRLPVSLDVSISNNRLKADYDNQLNITVRNNGEVPLSALAFSLSVPSPLLSVGRSEWSLNYLKAGGSFSISSEIFIPASSIGTTYNGGLSVTCRDDYGTSQTYNFPVGLIIVGNIELVISDNAIKPLSVSNGSRVEVTTTLLNKGTVPAIYVNASILPNAVLTLTTESYVYVGDVDENSQSPFTLAANISNTAKTGMYPVTLRISYRNDQNIDNSFDYVFNLNVNSDSSSGSTDNNGFVLNAAQVGIVIATIAVAGASIIIIYRSHIVSRNKREQGK